MCVFYAKMIFSETNIASLLVMCEGIISEETSSLFIFG